MPDQRKYVLSIAGFDPSAGAGLLADVKCFEQLGVYGFGVCSALTVQSDDRFTGVSWLGAGEIIAQLEPLLAKFEVRACKIGLIRDVEVLTEVTGYLRRVGSSMKLVLDPVLKSSSGFEFHAWNAGLLAGVLKQLDLITPNEEEIRILSAGKNAWQTAEDLAEHCPVLLKGGHNREAPGTDLLFLDGSLLEFKPGTGRVFQKHGSGCVLSASIVAGLALGCSLTEACKLGKWYTEAFLGSSPSLLGFHNRVPPDIKKTIKYEL